jgi:hypothetical protein
MEVRSRLMIKTMPLISLRRTSNPSSPTIISKGLMNQPRATTTKSQSTRAKSPRTEASTNHIEVALTMERAR